MGGESTSLLRNVPFFDYPALFKQHESEIMEILRRTLSKGAFIQQTELEAFERRFAEYLGVAHAIGVANCTDGLELALRACGLRAGDEVLLPSHTFVATASAVIAAGGTPVLVDCDEYHLMCHVSAARNITQDTRFLLPAHLNGKACRMDRLCELAAEHDLVIVEDAAQALGAKHNGRFAGTFGRAAAFSFYPAKSLGCFGDGGMVVTDDSRTAEELRLTRDHGRDGTGRVVRWGRNSRLDNIQAAILDFRLERFSDDIARRREIASLYDQGLGRVRQLVLPPGPAQDDTAFDVYQNYEVEAEDRDCLRAFLEEHGVGTILPWCGWPVHQHAGLGFKGPLPETDKLFERCLLFPMNQLLSNDDVAHVVDTVRTFYGD